MATFDPVAQYRTADGPAVTMADLASMPPPAPPAPRAPSAPRIGAATAAPQGTRFTLPPGLEQELTLDPDASYYGDALRAAHTREEKDIMYGGTPNTLFGGNAIVQSHLQGRDHGHGSRSRRATSRTSSSRSAS